MLTGDFLIHVDADGRIALHDKQTWRDNGEPLRYFATLGDAKFVARTDHVGIKIWYCHWKFPNRITPLP
jgi:hypothetical protein